MAEISIFFTLSLMLIFAIIGYILSRKINVPSTLLIIAFGIILGESVLGVARYDGTIPVIAQLGSIILMFIAGLNSDIREVFTRKNFYVALFGAIIPLIGGFIVSKLFGYSLYESIFVGATITATCVGITTAVLKELGKIKTESAKMMIGAAVIDDIIGLTILSIVLSVPNNVTALNIFWNILLIIGFVIIMIIFGSIILTKILEYFNDLTQMYNSKLTFVFGLSIVFMFSYLSYLLGLAPITGAFLVGASLSKSKVADILLSGSEYFEIVFTSVFFIVIGIVVDISAFGSMFLFIIVLSIVAILTKIIGSGYTAYRSGMKSRDSLIVGIGMAPRGEVAFIIALNGLMLGVITKQIYSAIVFTSLITTITTLILLKILYSKDKGRSIEEHVEFIDLKIRR